MAYKIKPSEYDEIINKIIAGKTKSEVAKEYGVSTQTIQNITRVIRRRRNG